MQVHAWPTVEMVVCRCEAYSASTAGKDLPLFSFSLSCQKLVRRNDVPTQWGSPCIQRGLRDKKAPKVFSPIGSERFAFSVGVGGRLRVLYKKQHTLHEKNKRTVTRGVF